MLIAIKLAHTLVWALLAGCVLAIPVLAVLSRFRWTAALTALILIECGILAVNRGRCPLTDLAARYTTERRANFDIFLPNWLAERNKTIFGALFVLGEMVVLWRWLRRPPQTSP